MPINGSVNDDVIFGAETDDEIFGGLGDDLLDGSDGGDRVYGDEGDDILVGSVDSADDLYDGGSGRDFITYYDALAGVRVDLSLLTNQATSAEGNSAGIGIDQIAGIEDVEGTRFNDFLTGNSANNMLIGMEGNDSLNGGLGNDTLLPGAGDDIVNGGGGTDTVDYSEIDHAIYLSLGATTVQSTGAGRDRFVSIENAIGSSHNDVLGGSASSNALYGMAGADRLNGGEGNDMLDGGTGADRMTGGVGNDSYMVDNAADLVLESAGEGTDTVIVTAALSVTLAANVENLTLTAASPLFDLDDDEDYLPATALSLTGNELANILRAGDGVNILDGGAGADRMYGGSGGDIYIVDNSADVVIEYSEPSDDEDYEDLVLASASYTISSVYIENLQLTGSANINGTGNAGNNWIQGNSGSNILKGGAGYDYLEGGQGNDTLDGGTGIDYLQGGLGDDTYIIDDVNDWIDEWDFEGVDTVKSNVGFSLQSTIENLELTGTANIDGYGSYWHNVMTGNAGANLLRGYGGDDMISGGAGNDTLYGDDGTDALRGNSGRDVAYGGTGADSFIFADGEFGGRAYSNCDVIQDFSGAEGDRINLDLVDANTLLAGNQSFSWIGSSAFSGVAGELRYNQTNGNTFVQGDINGDRVSDFLIQVTDLHALNSGHFIL